MSRGWKPYQRNAGPSYGRSVRCSQRLAFTLVEVAISLAIISLALIAVIGLLDVGLRMNGESSQQIQAADTLSILIATARATPTNLPVEFALPNLNQNLISNTVQIGVDGTTNTTNPTYNLRYTVGTNAVTGPKIAHVYLCLWWPLKAPLPSAPGNYCEMTAQVALP